MRTSQGRSMASLGAKVKCARVDSEMLRPVCNFVIYLFMVVVVVEAL